MSQHARNVRWGPCPHCKATGWDAPSLPGYRRPGLLDHDRPQGGRCLKSRKAKPAAIGGSK